MNKVQLKEVTVKKKDCHKVIWRNIPIGLIYEETDGQWRFSSELKGEFWSLNTFSSIQEACDELLKKRQELDKFRLSQLK